VISCLAATNRFQTCSMFARDPAGPFLIARSPLISRSPRARSDPCRPCPQAGPLSEGVSLSGPGLPARQVFQEPDSPNLLNEAAIPHGPPRRHETASMISPSMMPLDASRWG